MRLTLALLGFAAVCSAAPQPDPDIVLLFSDDSRYTSKALTEVFARAFGVPADDEKRLKELRWAVRNPRRGQFDDAPRPFLYETWTGTAPGSPLWSLLRGTGREETFPSAKRAVALWATREGKVKTEKGERLTSTRAHAGLEPVVAAFVTKDTVGVFFPRRRRVYVPPEGETPEQLAAKLTAKDPMVALGFPPPEDPDARFQRLLEKGTQEARKNLDQFLDAFRDYAARPIDPRLSRFAFMVQKRGGQPFELVWLDCTAIRGRELGHKAKDARDEEWFKPEEILDWRYYDTVMQEYTGDFFAKAVAEDSREDK